MRTIRQPRCPVCDGSGRTWRTPLRDRLFGALGEWSLQRCTDIHCGACWLDPMPDPRDLHLAYARYYTHAADARTQQNWWRAADLTLTGSREYGVPATAHADLATRLRAALPHRRELARFSRLYLTQRDGRRLLDVGCGAGDQMLMLRDLGWDVRGLDVDPSAVTAALARGLRVDVGDLRSRHGAQDADAITLVHVIEHLVEPRRHLEAARLHLAAGGRLVIITPNVDSLGARLFGVHWRGLEPPRHLQLFSLASLKRLVSSCGFEIEMARSSARSSAALLRASRSLRKLASGRESADPTEPRPTASDNLLQLVEHAAVGVGIPLGEELVLVARRAT